MPNQKTTCSSGETWPVLSRSSTNCAILYRGPPMTVYVISDLHLDEQAEARLFSDERQGRELATLCERVARDEGAELILLGDCFDFTAMLPPPEGLERFFRKLDVPCE